MFSSKAVALITLAVLAAHAPTAKAATILVPAHWDTITSAIANAAAGDTIEITNSATYVENVSVNKRITLMATAGQTPVIQGSTVGSVVFSTVNGAEGAQIGSDAGGRIEIRGGAYTGTGDYLITRCNHTGEEPVVFENLLINAHAPLAGAPARAYGIYPRYSGNSIYRNVIVDGGGVAGTAIRLHYLAIKTMELDRVQIRNFASYGISISHSSPTLVLKQCDIQTSVAAVRTYSISSGVPEPKITIDRCKLWGGSDSGVVMRGSNSSYTISRSLIGAPSGRSLYLFEGSNNVQLTVDHCDLVGTAGTNPVVDINGGTDRTISITNSNIWSPSAPGLDILGTSVGTHVSNHNNVYTPAGAAYTGITAGANDVQPGQDPNYPNVASGNVRYTNAFLKTAGQGGSAIGVYQDYTDLMNFVPVTRALHWSFY